jgi:hypothetical protein
LKVSDLRHDNGLALHLAQGGLSELCVVLRRSIPIFIRDAGGANSRRAPDHRARKGLTMAHIMSSLRDRIQKRAAYNRTVREIRSMPLDVALDLNIYQGDAEKIAAEAIYGR